MSDYIQVPPFTESRPERGVKVTVTPADPEQPIQEFFLDNVHIEQNRPIHSETNPFTGEVVALRPDQITSVTLRGSYRVPPA